MPELRGKINKNITKGLEYGQLSNSDLVQIIECAGDLLNLQTRSSYAKSQGISYNGAKKFRQNVNLFGATFVIDND